MDRRHAASIFHLEIIIIVVIMTIRAYPYSRDPAILPLAVVINNFNI